MTRALRLTIMALVCGIVFGCASAGTGIGPSAGLLTRRDSQPEAGEAVSGSPQSYMDGFEFEVPTRSQKSDGSPLAWRMGFCVKQCPGPTPLHGRRWHAGNPGPSQRCTHGRLLRAGVHV